MESPRKNVPRPKTKVMMPKNKFLEIKDALDKNIDVATLTQRSSEIDHNNHSWKYVM